MHGGRVDGNIPAVELFGAFAVVGAIEVPDAAAEANGSGGVVEIQKGRDGFPGKDVEFKLRAAKIIYCMGNMIQD